MLLADFESINLVAEYAGVASSEDWSSLIDLLHERLGKLVSLRSRPADLALVSPRELEAIGRTIAQLTSHTGALCGGRVSASLGLSHTTLTVVSRLAVVTYDLLYTCILLN